MIRNSNIEWTGPTWNPWQGCVKKSPGCKNCYMYREKRRWGQNPAAAVMFAVDIAGFTTQFRLPSRRDVPRRG